MMHPVIVLQKSVRGRFTICERMGPTGGDSEYPVCVTYAAGELEQASNLSQLLGSKVSVLDPRVLTDHADDQHRLGNHGVAAGRLRCSVR